MQWPKTLAKLTKLHVSWPAPIIFTEDHYDASFADHLDSLQELIIHGCMSDEIMEAILYKLPDTIQRVELNGVDLSFCSEMDLPGNESGMVTMDLNVLGR